MYMCTGEGGWGGVAEKNTKAIKTLTLMIHFHVSNMTWKKKIKTSAPNITMIIYYHDTIINVSLEIRC